jgi:hypothetical protein
MKQLLTWCGSRALPEKPSGDVKNANAIMAARAIQQELIDDFASKPELSDWFSRVRTLYGNDWKPPLTAIAGRDCATTSSEKTEPPKRKERDHTAGVRGGSETVRNALCAQNDTC